MLVVLRKWPPHVRQTSTTLIHFRSYMATFWEAGHPSYILKSLTPIMRQTPTWDPLEYAQRLFVLWTRYTHSIHSTYHIVHLLCALVSAHVIQIRRKLVTRHLSKLSMAQPGSEVETESVFR